MSFNLSDVILHLYPSVSFPADCSIANNGGNLQIVYWNTAKLGPQPSQATIDAAIPAAMAAYDATVTDELAYVTDRETLKTQIAQEIADIDTFLAVASPNNAAVLNEVRAIDRRLKAILKFLRRL